MKHSRKTFLKTLVAGTLASSAGSLTAKPQIAKTKHPLKLGIASYSLRAYMIDEVISIAKQLDIKHVALKSMHMPLNNSDAVIRNIANKFKQAGLDLYGAGVVYMKSAAEVKNAFRYAKAAGMRVIIGVPNPELLPLVNEKVQETDIKLAIHNHGPGDDIYPSPESAYEKIKDMDPRMGLCIDIGHTLRIGLDPAKDIKRFADRLFDLHIKDVTMAAPKGENLELGRGVMDIPGVIKALRKIKYSGVMGLEYEKNAKNAFPGLAESVGYARGVMNSV